MNEFSKGKRIFLLVLLIALSLAIRLQNDHQTDFDSYWLHAQAESIQLHESALWVFHPASIFGYYPMSYPSGTMFFLATASSFLGLDMNQTVFITSVFTGLLITLLVFAFAHRLTNSWLTAYIAAFVTSLSPLFVNYTAFNAGGRVLIMIFYIPMLLCGLLFYERKRFSYLLAFASFLLFSFITHRTSQLLVLFIFALACAFIYMYVPKIWDKVSGHRYFKKHLHTRYAKNKYVLLFDFAIIMILLVALKIGDLIIRGRLATNVERLIVEPAANFGPLLTVQLSLLVGFVIILLAALLAFIQKKKNFLGWAKGYFHKYYHGLFDDPEPYFCTALLFVAAYFFIGQFFGLSFYAPSYKEYQISEYFIGSDPSIIFTNFLINYTTSISAVFIFMFVGFVAMLFKKRKDFGHWVLIFSFIAFCGVLLDKRYTRLFLVPFFSIFISYGILWLYQWVGKLFKNKKVSLGLSFAFSLLMCLGIIVSTFVPLVRDSSLGRETTFENIGPYWETGQYLRSLDCDCSTITTKELTAGVVIFASSGLPGGSHNIYYYVDDDKIRPNALPYEELKERITSGRKVQGIWFQEDWIFGGQYYIGRHTRYLFDNPYTDQTVQQIVADYNEQFYIHDKLEAENDFLRSIDDVKNVVYDNPKATVFDIHKGRDSY